MPQHHYSLFHSWRACRLTLPMYVDILRKAGGHIERTLIIALRKKLRDMLAVLPDSLHSTWIDERSRTRHTLANSENGSENRLLPDAFQPRRLFRPAVWIHQLDWVLTHVAVAVEGIDQS